MKKLTYIFDSFAVIAYLQAEPGGQEVRELLKKEVTETGIQSDLPD